MYRICWYSVLCVAFAFHTLIFDLVFGGEVPDTEIDALQALYSATNGIDWYWRNISEYGTVWNFTSTGVPVNPCVSPVWQGIACSANCTLDTSADCHILEISLDEYNLVGSLPESIADISQLQTLIVSHNSIMNTIPSVIGNLINLTEFVIYHNCFTGSIPSDISNLQNLSVLDMGANCLTGSIPTEFGLLTNLVAFMVNKNDLLGTMPSEIGYMSKLLVLLLHENDFYGTVPSTYSNLKSLEALDISHSEITGPLNIEFGADLTYAFIGDNHLSGTFPEQICTCTKLVHLSIDNMLLVGTLPTCLGSFLKMTYLHPSNNLFTGTLPTQVGLLSSLVTARLGSMLLKGEIGNVFTNYLPELQTLELSNNQFSGAIPSAIFSPKLETFSASQNCFSDSITDHICDAGALETLDLSGLTAGTGCKVTVQLLGMFGVEMAPNVRGTIPRCIFAMPNLTQVSMSGNGIRSPLYELESPRLRILELSNNRLIGTIPVSIQSKFDLLKVDVAYNQLGGTIEHMNYSAMSNPEEADSALVAVESNRLSGRIPELFMDSDATVNICAGNLFECEHNRLPKNDPDADHYECGSEQLDQSIIAFAAFFAVFLMLSLVQKFKLLRCISWNKRGDKYIGHGDVNHLDVYILRPLRMFIMWNYDSRTGQESLDQLSFSLWKFCRYCLFATVLIVCVLLPVIILIKLIDNEKYSTHTYQYSWVISLAFVAKDTAAVAIASAWIGLILLVTLFEYFSNNTREDGKFLLEILYSRITGTGRKRQKNGIKFPESKPMAQKKDKQDQSPTALNQSNNYASWKWFGLSKLDVHRWKIFFCKTTLIFLNFVIVLGVNGSYVYVVLTQDTAYQTLAFTGTVLFKLLWNPLCVLPLTSAMYLGENVTQAIVVFNNILAPIVATVFVDINCLQVMFVAPDEVTLEFYYKECTLVQFNTCVRYSYKIVTDSFVPPWFYSQQCYSSVLVHYIPVYMVLYGVMEFFTPVAQLFALWCFSESVGSNERVETRAIRRSSSARTLKTLKGGWMSLLTNGIVSTMVLPIDSLDDLKEQHDCLLRLNCLLDLRESLSHDLKADNETEVNEGSATKTVPVLMEQDVLSPEKFTSTVFLGTLINVPPLYLVKEKCHNSVVMLTVLLTYGIAFPPLACICALNIVVTCLSMQLFIFHHYQQFKLRMNSTNPLIAGSARECYNVWSDIVANEIKESYSILFENRTFLYLISVLSLMMFIFDATTSDGENEGVYASLVCIALGVYLMRVTVIVLRRRYPPAIGDDCYMKEQYANSVQVNVITVDNPIQRASECGVELANLMVKK